ncbi:MAG: DUF4258 domain-containing protein [archaeon]|nr:DUF4258 domain-containing protein [archaeon]
MKIIFTAHAEERLNSRLIKREWVEETIRNPDKLIEAKFGRKQAVKKIMKYIISVVYVKENEDFVVITIFWGE